MDEETVFPAWFYGPNEGGADIFNAAADVPKGWSRYQGKAEATVDATDEIGDNTPKRRGRPPKVAEAPEAVEVTEDEF